MLIHVHEDLIDTFDYLLIKGVFVACGDSILLFWYIYSKKIILDFAYEESGSYIIKS